MTTTLPSSNKVTTRSGIRTSDIADYGCLAHPTTAAQVEFNYSGISNSKKCKAFMKQFAESLHDIVCNDEVPYLLATMDPVGSSDRPIYITSPYLPIIVMEPVFSW